MSIGNWQARTGGEEITASGRHAIIARNGAILEISIDGNNWETVHTFPPTEGEVFEIDLPTETYLRVSGGGQWTISKFNEMSG